MAKTNFDDLMQRYVTGQVTEEELTRIEAWLNMLEDKNTKDLQLTDQEEEALYQKIISKKENIDAIRSYRPESLARNQRSKWTTRIAAGIVILCTVGFFAYRLTQHEGGVVTEQQLIASDTKKVILEDGSIVWLKQGAEISYRLEGNSRQVKFTGEALFEVAKNPSLPFIIHGGNIDLKVVGTSFSFRTGDQAELKVLTGKVAVTSTNDSTVMMATKNEKVIYTAQHGLEKSTLETTETKTITAHTGYDMHFTEAPLNEVVKRLNKKFDVTITIDNPQAGECHVNLDVTDNSMEDSLKKITAILKLEYKIDGSVIKLTGTGCR